MSRWLCCQLSSREDYAVPRALHGMGRLEGLITDAWVRPRLSNVVSYTKALAGLRGRYHADLDGALVHSFTGALIKFELSQRFQKGARWEVIIRRNHWFQQQVLKVIDSFGADFASSRPALTVFAYSYAAVDIFRYAKSKGWSTVLGQIDPGPAEEEVVEKAHRKIGGYKSEWRPAPSEHWKGWREECSLADRIVVNSTWSRNGLLEQKVAPEKIVIAPLAYEPPSDASTFVRAYPPTFSPGRPMRVLFLGQVNVRKGVVQLLDAADLLRNEPIEFCFAGPVSVSSNGTVRRNVRFVGPVSRSVAGSYYQRADVFVFPTLSDGFGLTQLEASAWKLPIIASRACGEVVRDRENGLLLNQVTPETIASALLHCVGNPGDLQSFSDCAANANFGGLGEIQNCLELADQMRSET